MDRPFSGPLLLRFSRLAKSIEPSDAAGVVPKEPNRPSEKIAELREPAHIKELELQIRDLEITNRVKDQVIGMKDQQIAQLQKDQHDYIERLIDSRHRIGELETKLLRLESPEVDKLDSSTKLKVTSLE